MLAQEPFLRQAYHQHCLEAVGIRDQPDWSSQPQYAKGGIENSANSCDLGIY